MPGLVSGPWGLVGAGLSVSVGWRDVRLSKAERGIRASVSVSALAALVIGATGRGREPDGGFPGRTQGI